MIDAFTTGEVAVVLGISQASVTRLFDQGLLRGYRVPLSQHRRIPVTALWQFLEQQGIRPPLRVIIGEDDDDVVAEIRLDRPNRGGVDLRPLHEIRARTWESARQEALEWARQHGTVEG